MAKRIGATPIALTRTSDKRDALIKAGATHVIATQEEDLVDEVMRLTQGKGADCIFDPVGGPTFAKLVSAAAVGGKVLVYGAMSDQVTPLPMLEVLAKRITIHGCNLFNTTTTPALQKAAVDFIFKGLEEGSLQTTIAKCFRFDDIADAHRELAKNEHVGRIVVKV